jgi:hypothetical protein
MLHGTGLVTSFCKYGSSDDRNVRRIALQLLTQVETH